MGWIRHNAIVVTSWDDALIKKAATKARKLGLEVLGPSDEMVNGYRSFLVVPNGSKRGWEDHLKAKRARGLFFKFLDKQCFPDGGSSLEWVAIAYGNDDQQARITDSTWGMA